MKRSLQVTAPLLTTTALSLLTACHQQPEMQRCVDEQNRVVADSLCGKPQQGMRSDGHGGFIPYIIPYRYYYGGMGGYGLGTTVSGGSATPLAGHSYGNSSTTRGGFGSTHGGGGEGGGEGGGHGGGGGE